MIMCLKGRAIPKAMFLTILKTGQFEIRTFLFRFQKMVSTASICPYFKWSGFWISDFVWTSFWLFEIQTHPDFRSPLCSFQILVVESFRLESACRLTSKTIVRSSHAFLLMYSGDLKSDLVWILNGPKEVGLQMVFRMGSEIRKPNCSQHLLKSWVIC